MVGLCIACRCDLTRTSRLLSLAAVVALCSRVEAVDTFWSNSRGDGSGTFSLATNWSPSVPGTSDVAHFGRTISSLSPKAYTVTFTTDPTNLRLVIEDDAVTFNLNGHFYQATSPIAVMLGTESGLAGQLTVTGGLFATPLEADINIGQVAGSAGVLNVTTGGLVLGSPEVFVGLNSAGTLNIDSGGDLIADGVRIGKNAGISGVAIVTGAGSSLVTTDLHVGGGLAGGAGMLTIANSGHVDSSYAEISSQGAGASATVTGPNSKWTSSSQLNVGLSGNGSLSITDGGQVQDVDASIGAASVGTATIDGPSSKWSHSGDFRIGLTPTTSDNGLGTLNVTGGALVENTNADADVEIGGSRGTGVVNVDGPNSRWINASDLTVGRRSTADNVVNITNGGVVQNADAILGELNDSGFDRGTVIVSDPGSHWVASSVVVGSLGHGTLKVLAGGRVDVASTLQMGLSDFGVGEVFVDGPASALIVDGELTVGGNATGALAITGGGVVQCATARMPSGGGAGSVVVSGAGSTWFIGDDLTAGPFGGGTLRIQPGGLIIVGDTITLNNNNALHLEGGVLTARRIAFPGTMTPFFWTSGTLHLGNLRADLTIPNGGILAPGVELGTTDVEEGDVTLSPGGTLQIQIGGVSPGVTHDFLDVFLGNVILAGGNLQLGLVNGFVPAPTDGFTIVNVQGGSVSGSFANVASGQRLSTSDGLGSFIVDYSSGSSVTLSSFQPGLPGDYNQNGVVDAADYVVWRNGIGSGTSLPNDDTPGVGQDDFGRWRSRFGQTAGGGAASNAAVPEPMTALLFVLGAMIGSCKTLPTRPRRFMARNATGLS